MSLLARFVCLVLIGSFLTRQGLSLPFSRLPVLRCSWFLLRFDQRFDSKDTLDEPLDGRTNGFFECGVYCPVAVECLWTDVLQISPEYRHCAHQGGANIFLGSRECLRGSERADLLSELLEEGEELLPGGGRKLAGAPNQNALLLSLEHAFQVQQMPLQMRQGAVKGLPLRDIEALAFPRHR